MKDLPDNQVRVRRERRQESTEHVAFGGRWGYRITRYVEVLTASEESYYIGVPGTYYCADTHLTRDGAICGASHRDVIGATIEAREAAIAKRMGAARKRKGGVSD